MMHYSFALVLIIFGYAVGRIHQMIIEGQGEKHHE